MEGDQRRADFLWLVQMIMESWSDQIDGWTGMSGEALAASYRIPSDLTIREAAFAFCGMYIDGFAGEGTTEAPSWLHALKDR